MARPRKNLRSEDYSKITSLASKGCSHAQIARHIEIDAKTLRERLKDDPEAAAAYAEGKGDEEAALVGLLRKKAEDGDAPSAMFLLKSRHGYRDRGETDGGSQPGVSVTISLPGPLAPDAYAKLIEGVAVDTGSSALSKPVEAR
jgi:hypothetical protein